MNNSSAARRTDRPRYLALAAGILLLAAFMRLAQIDRVPPGMDNDEAFHLLRAQEIVHGESLPIYITGNNGNDPLYAYTAAMGIALVGPTLWAGRLMAAFVGLLGVALTIRLGAEMFPGRRVGLLAGFFLATFFWHVNFSRFGSQPILAATAAVGTLTALWRGARTGKMRYSILAGVALSLGLDAYVAFRLFPMVALVAGLALLIAHPAQRSAIGRGGIGALIAATIVYAPLAWFFINNPQWFFNRFGQTTEGVLNAEGLLTNASKTIGGLFWAGPMDWRFNIAGRPALDIAQTIFFIVGAIMLLRWWRKPETWTLFVWLIIGLAPSVLTNEAPHFGRTTMATSAIAIIIALGIASLWRIADFRLARAAMAGIVAISFAIPIWLYLNVWANDPRVAESFDIRQVKVAQELKAAPPGAFLYATPLHVGWLHDYWTTEYLLGRDALARFSPFNGTLCSVVPANLPNGARYVVVASPEADDLRTPKLLAQLFPDVQRTEVSVPGDRYPMSVYDVLPNAQPRIDSKIAPVEFGGLARLIDYQITPAKLEAGKRLQIQVVWQTLAPSAAPQKLFVQLLGTPKNDGSPVYAQFDGEPCAQLWHTHTWRANELLFDTYALRVPENLPAGTFQLEIGWYDEATGARVPLGQAKGDASAFRLAEFVLR